MADEPHQNGFVPRHANTGIEQRQVLSVILSETALVGWLIRVPPAKIDWNSRYMKITQIMTKCLYLSYTIGERATIGEVSRTSRCQPPP